MPSSPGDAEPARPGVLLVDKPAGPTSHDIVARARREHGLKAGHAGTLDPFATGLLIVLLGREATRCQARFMELPKTYRAVARFGAVSTTGDPEGEITETGNLPPDELDLPTGPIRQRLRARIRRKRQALPETLKYWQRRHDPSDVLL